jgi:aromatic-L-amino-acid decarboxylase
MAAASAAAPGAQRGLAELPQAAQARWLALLMNAGGGERLALGPQSRRNRYGVPAVPAPDELWFSSSTACAASPRGWAAAEAALGALLAGHVRIGGWFESLRARLLALYGAPGAEAVLAASGTEAELVALQLAMALAGGRAIVNILIAPAETGSGAPAAAAGRHFLGESSLAGPVSSGARLVGWQDAAIALEPIEIRRPDGRPRSAAAVDREAESRVEQAISAGAFVILHALDASKTGRPGVSRATARRLSRRHPGRLLGLVDACQLRCPAEAIRADLEHGLAVMITGSKFAAGPPFSGALLLPAALAETLADGPSAGAALAPYSAALDWPARLRSRLTAGLAHAANLGLGLRWSAALAEIEAFEAIEPHRRRALLAAFDAAVRERVAEDPGLALLDSRPGAPGLISVVQRDGDARAVYEALQQADGPLGRPAHLGQPVIVGGQTALRVCASMPMITAAAETGPGPLEADLDGLFDAWAALRRQASSPPAPPQLASLDPADWQAFRADACRALDHAIDRLEAAGEGPVWRQTPASVRQRFAQPLPREGRPLAEVLADVERLITPYGVGNTHPKFFGWAHGAGTPVGMLAEMLAAGLDLNCGGRDHIGPVVERQITGWAAEAFGFPAQSSGVFVTGASQANFLGLLVARDAALGHGVRQSGLRAASAQLTAYASAEAHGCVAQAMEMAGIGGDFLRRIETDGAGAIRPHALATAIADDRAAGRRPFLVVGTAGAVNFGAFDDLAALAELCETEGLWLHVDGAFGALTALSARLRPLTRGLERAHSLAFDFHKWAHAPYDAGFLLVRDAGLHRATFAAPADYLTRAARGLAAGEDWPCDFGPDLSRGFRALKVWLTFEALGSGAIAAAIEANCAAAAHLTAAIEASGVFELAAPAPLNIVCFALKGDEGGERTGELVMRLQERGLAAPSTTRIGGRLVARAAIFNHRTALADVDDFLDAAIGVAAELG